MERIPAAEVRVLAARYRRIAVIRGASDPAAQMIVQRLLESGAPLDEGRSETFEADMVVAAAMGDAIRSERGTRVKHYEATGRIDVGNRVAVPCPICEEYQYEQLMDEHMKKQHPDRLDAEGNIIYEETQSAPSETSVPEPEPPQASAGEEPTMAGKMECLDCGKTFKHTKRHQTHMAKGCGKKPKGGAGPKTGGSEIVRLAPPPGDIVGKLRAEAEALRARAKKVDQAADLLEE